MSKLTAPTCVICKSRPAQRTLPGNGIPWVELICGRHGGAEDFDSTDLVLCASCALSNLDEVFAPHVLSVLAAAKGVRGAVR